MTDWERLPRPVGFVLSGGATMGAMQVGMLAALGEAGLTPDVVAGTSAGALNGAVVAAVDDLHDAVAVLDRGWRGLETDDVFPGGWLRQGWRLLTHRSLFPNDGLRQVIDRTLAVDSFAALAHPFGALVTDVLTTHPRLFTSGRLVPALLASAAIPALYPAVVLDGQPYWDGGLVASVPLGPALQLGAASLVVLDVGDVCHREHVPSGLPDTVAAGIGIATRQRVLVEAPAVAAEHPVLYVPRPCVFDHDPLQLDDAGELVTAAHHTASAFLADAPLPAPGRMVGTPHTHEGDPPSRTVPVASAP